MNSPNRIIPSFLSNLLCVLPNIRHKIVTIIIKPKSTIIFEFTGIGVMVLLKPSTNKILNMFDPITFPITNWFSSLFRAVSEVTSSGSDVPIATIVKPTNVSLIPHAIAIYDDEFTTSWAPRIIAASPTTT